MAGGDLLESVALVTGGSKGLGLEIARLLKKGGYLVAISYRSDVQAARDVSIELEVPIYQADLEVPEDVERLFDMIECEIGPVSVLVNNAASFVTGPILSLGPDGFSEGMDGVIYPTILPIMRAVKGMKEKGFGRIVNMGMAGSLEVKAYREVAVHAAAKTALAVLTTSLASELEGTGVTINMISPGIMDRPEKDDSWRGSMMEGYGLSRLVPPTEVASEVVALVKGPETGLIKDYL
ncbi:MAG: SDR family oxidoreductase [Thermoplasmata archaeon]|nr:SDR family oxidoreductase [Thermoplasmata archaeon]